MFEQRPDHYRPETLPGIPQPKDLNEAEEMLARPEYAHARRTIEEASEVFTSAKARTPEQTVPQVDSEDDEIMDVTPDQFVEDDLGLQQ